MKRWQVVVVGVLVVGLAGCASRDGERANPATQPATASTQTGEAEWSEAVDGLRGRVVMHRKRVFNGTAIIDTTLELQNEGDKTLAFSWGVARTRYIVADAQGNEHPQHMPFSGSSGERDHVVIAPGEIGVIDLTVRGMVVDADMVGALGLGIARDNWEFPSADTDYYLTVAFTVSPLDETVTARQPWKEALPPPPPPGSVPWYGTLELPRARIPLTPDPLPPNVGELIEQLGAKMLERPNHDSSREAADALSLIDDERVIPWYVKLAVTRVYSAKFIALSRLSRFDTDAALEGIQSCMAVRGEDFDYPSSPTVHEGSARNIRVSAAYALARCRHPQAKPLLLTMQDDPHSSVRLIVLQTFGKQDVNEPNAREVDDLIEKLLDDPDGMVRRQAKEYQELRKNKSAAR